MQSNADHSVNPQPNMILCDAIRKEGVKYKLTHYILYNESENKHN